MSEARLWTIHYFDGSRQTVFAPSKEVAKAKATRDVWILRVTPVVCDSIWKAIHAAAPS